MNASRDAKMDSLQSDSCAMYTDSYEQHPSKPEQHGHGSTSQSSHHHGVSVVVIAASRSCSTTSSPAATSTTSCFLGVLVPVLVLVLGTIVLAKKH